MGYAFGGGDAGFGPFALICAAAVVVLVIGGMLWAGGQLDDALVQAPVLP